MTSVSQIIRWRQGRAVVSPRTAQPKAALAEPTRAPAAASVTVSIGKDASVNAATYTDRIRRSLRVKMEQRAAVANRRSIPGESASGTSASAATAADAWRGDSASGNANTADMSIPAADSTASVSMPASAAASVSTVSITPTVEVSFAEVLGSELPPTLPTTPITTTSTAPSSNSEKAVTTEPAAPSETDSSAA